MLVRTLIFSSIVFCSCSCGAKNFSDDSLVKKPNNIPTVDFFEPQGYCRNVIGVCNPITKFSENFIYDQSLYAYGVDTLPQVKFWRRIMNLHEDTAIVNFISTRTFIQKLNAKEWDKKNDEWKKFYRDSIRSAWNLDTTNRIAVTTGKKYFYDFEKTSRNFHQGINCFIDNNVDPWYAQAILLIESPNKLQKSNAGAYGSFQLMKDVARMYGLKVNKQIDERADFSRSAYAASSLIKKICIPNARKMLDSLSIKHINEEELWFRLLVMHIYHAGTYNVRNALFALNPSEANMTMIYNLWQIQTKRFKSASQNYSQLVLAAMLEMNERAGLALRKPYLSAEK
ncbi:MAG: hypothetical protein KF900_00720 [Bacteroidetes bacterium]|nr:hypothetical protein [Bacteroidota bacterium]